MRRFNVVTKMIIILSNIRIFNIKKQQLLTLCSFLFSELKKGISLERRENINFEKTFLTQTSVYFDKLIQIVS